MGQSTKAILQVIVLLVPFAMIIAWAPRARESESLWALRYGILAVGAVAILLLVRNALRKEVLQDHLAEAVGRKYFERDGLCFAPQLCDVDGVAFMNIFFQNRYARPCRCDIMMRPTGGLLGLTRSAVRSVGLVMSYRVCK